MVGRGPAGRVRIEMAINVPGTRARDPVGLAAVRLYQAKWSGRADGRADGRNACRLSMPHHQFVVIMRRV